MNLIFTSFFILIFHLVLAQQNKGAIKTKNGFLLYFNIGINSHTLNLDGDIDLSEYPFIKQNNIWFEFNSTNKADFGKDSKSILTNYMNWEVDYLQKKMSAKLDVKNEFLSQNNLDINFWQFRNPVIKDDRIKIPVIASYYLNFVHEGLIYSFSYFSTSGKDNEAKEILFKIADNIRFYDSNINLEKLRQNILQNKNYYEN